MIVFEYSQKLFEKVLFKFMKYMLFIDFEKYRKGNNLNKNDKVIGYRDVFLIIFKGYS